VESTLKFHVYRRQQLVFSGEFGGPVEFGRQQKNTEPLFVEQPNGACRRFAIARLAESMISRAHLRVEPADGGQVRATNLSSANAILLEDGSMLGPTKSCLLSLPALFTMADAGVRVEPCEEAAEAEWNTLAKPTIAPQARSRICDNSEHLRATAGILTNSATGGGWVGPGIPGGPASQIPAIPNLLTESTKPAAPVRPLPTQASESVVAWLQAVIEVLQSAASSTDFFERAAEAVVNLVGLDTGSVLLADGEQWRTASQFFSLRVRGANVEPRPSARMLARMRKEKRTFWHAPELTGHTPAVHSLTDVQAVVVAPLLDAAGEVIGAVYGDRRSGLSVDAAPTISRLEAMIVETLACGVAAGLSRLEHEKKALAARVQFEQFFTPELAHQLTVEPDLLKGRDVEVTLMFADIRGFSRVSDRLGPARTVEWVSHVMSGLSDCVTRHGGVLVDYIGDELMAMWGAPLAQPDHAMLACRAALDMWHVIPTLNERWHKELGEPFGLGIGVNTGIARVGNTGSDRKFKYGPLGSTVNIASRVQGATKYLKSGVVVTAATNKSLGPEFAARRLCHVRVVNIAEPIELYELRDAADAAGQALGRQYEAGLKQFEAHDFRNASATLAQILAQHPDDGPTLVLLSRAVNQLINPDDEFSLAWELPGK
jgi:adenylate cyclase